MSARPSHRLAQPLQYIALHLIAIRVVELGGKMFIVSASTMRFASELGRRSSQMQTLPQRLLSANPSVSDRPGAALAPCSLKRTPGTTRRPVDLLLARYANTLRDFCRGPIGADTKGTIRV